MNIFIKNLMLVGLTTSIALHASERDAQPLLQNKIGTNYFATSGTSSDLVGELASMERGLQTNHISPFQKMFHVDGKPGLAQLANGLYAHATPQHRAKLDALFKDREPESQTRSRRKSSSRPKESEGPTSVDLVADTTQDLLHLVSGYVEQTYKKPMEALKEEHSRKTRRTNCCAMITSVASIVVTNLLTSYMNKKHH